MENPVEDSRIIKDLLAYLRSRPTPEAKPEVATPKEITASSPRIRRSKRYGVVGKIVRLYHRDRDATIISLVDGIVGRSIKARETGECQSADKYAARLADVQLGPALEQTGFRLNGYSFEANVQDWRNIRSQLANKGHGKLWITERMQRVAEMARSQAREIIKEVGKELQKRVA